MANVNHKDLPNSELHEPKGASTASSSTVYVSDGAGSGSWSTAPYTYTLNVRLDDISTAGSAYVAVPVQGTIAKIYTVIDGAIATADASLTFDINGTPITGSGITVAFTGSAAGDVDSSTPSAANTPTAGQYITVTTDGASTNAVSCNVTLEIDVG